MKVSRIVVGLMAGSGLLASWSDTSFADAHRPGSLCWQNGTGILERTGGTIRNASTTQELQLLCPMIKEDDAMRPSLRVAYFDRHPTLNVSCTLIAQEFVGEDVFTFTNSNNSAGKADDSVGFFNVGVMPFSKVVTAECSIPRKVNGKYSHLIRFHD